MADLRGVLVTCEHAGNEIPDGYRHLFESAEAAAALESHRGWDAGALELAQALASRLGAPLVAQPVSRLLVECNRSIGHPRLWSEFSKSLSAVDKERVLDLYWRAHRERVRRAVMEGGTTVHVGVHTFTPTWEGRRRATEVGILYDPRRAAEGHLAGAWRNRLAAAGRGGRSMPELTVHLNRPYRGWTDGLVTTLRGEFPESRYLGFELEVSQALVPLSEQRVVWLAQALGEAMVTTRA